ncbi:hypothetical protein LIER_05789 [Lithospermum erythrorhizon]|uniref:Reverse transcriptase/retrotransposon-derived protein RNase H-like domain-containing protein n=1 Tax=Lithospermum erythrorhizon TaxID=34254 RepID=A0AAV3P3E5_LITER
MISQRGTEPNLDKISVVKAIRSPKTEKEAQWLTSGIAALTRFISRAGDRSLLFFKAIKKVKYFEWTPDCEHSFQELKNYLQSPLMLAQPMARDVLQLYLAVSESALKSFLIREEDKVQRLVYYVSKVMRGAETRYPQTEKLVYALIVAARKLKPYFEAHPVKVVTDQPLLKILENPSMSGRIVKWAIELNGVSNPGGSGAGILLWSHEGNKIDYDLRFAFTTTKNEAAYEALANGITLVNALAAEHIYIRMDSRLLVGHVKGYFKIDETKERERNQEADRSSQVATVEYETPVEATVVEWVQEEAFRTKEVRNSDAPEEAEFGHVRRPHQFERHDAEDPMFGRILALNSHGCKNDLCESNEPGNLQGCAETATTGGRYLGSLTSNSSMVVPDNPEPHHWRNLLQTGLRI